jgi:hypothetical protein
MDTHQILTEGREHNITALQFLKIFLYCYDDAGLGKTGRYIYGNPIPLYSSVRVLQKLLSQLPRDSPQRDEVIQLQEEFYIRINKLNTEKELSTVLTHQEKV